MFLPLNPRMQPSGSAATLHPARELVSKFATAQNKNFVNISNEIPE
jgi:hypothetical protein